MTGVGVHMPPSSLTFFALSFLIDFFRGCWKYGPIIRKIIEDVLFAVQKQIFQKNTFCTLPPSALGFVAQSTHACKFDPSRFFDPRRDLLRKHSGVYRSPAKIM